ncbi:MAG: ATP-binding cassette domain-containing protein [Treponemataceae bacterium]|nr:ATP-binding cassette domain-containing protein [Treponemataceae bacterium]
MNIEKNCVLILSGIVKNYKNLPVLNGLDMEINNGSVISIEGKNGCGKTTLLSIILGFEKADRGCIIGKKLGEGISGYINRPILFRDMTVLDNIKYFFMLAKKEIEERVVLDCLDYLNIRDTNKKAKELSTGMQKKVAILRHLLNKSDLYVFDEPFSGLDEESIEKMRNLFKKEVTERHSSILYTNHQKEILVSESQRNYILENGVLKCIPNLLYLQF